MAKIGDICEVVSGFGFPLELQGDTTGEVPFYKVSDMNLAGNEQYMLTHNNSLSVKKISELNYRVFPENTIIFPKIGAAIATNKKRLLSTQSIFDNNVMGFIPLDNIYHLYLYYLVQDINISVWASESQPPSIRKSTVECFEIPLPPLQTQKKIAEILEEADSLRKLRKQADEKMQDLIPSLFVEMFGDPGTNPKGWKVEKIGDVLKVKSGNFLPAKLMSKSGTYPVYGGNGINGYHNEYMFDESKIIIGRVGALCGCIHITKPKSWITDNALYICEKYIPFNDKFMASFLDLLGLNKKATSMAQPQINGKTLCQLEIPFSPLSFQEKFAARVEEIEAEKARQAESRKKLDELFSSLMQRAFTGNLVA